MFTRTLKNLNETSNNCWVCVIKVYSNGCAIGDIITKDNLNKANLMQALENFLLLLYSTEF